MVYDEVFSFSQQAMINYMAKHQEKGDDSKYIAHVVKHGTGRGFEFTSGDARQAEVTQGQVGGGAHLGPQGKDVKAHHILVLLLRLRQVRGIHC